MNGGRPVPAFNPERHVTTQVNDHYFVCDACGQAGSERWALRHEFGRPFIETVDQLMAAYQCEDFDRDTTVRCGRCRAWSGRARDLSGHWLYCNHGGHSVTQRWNAPLPDVPTPTWVDSWADRVAALPNWAILALGTLLWLAGGTALFCGLHWLVWGAWPSWR